MSTHTHGFRRADVLILSGAHLAHDTFSSFLAPMLPLLMEKLGISLSLSALLDIVRRAPNLLNPILGLVAEKTGVRYFVILTPAVTAICMGLTGLAPSTGILLVLLFVAGLSAALFHVPAPVFVKEAAGDRVGTGMSFFMVGGELARTLGPLLVISVISYWSLEQIYRLIPLGLAASLVLFFKLRNIDADRPARPQRPQGVTRQILRKYRGFFLSVAGFLSFQTVMKSALTLYLPVYLIDQGASLWFAGVSLSVLQFFGVLGTFVAGNVSDRIGRRQTLVLSSFGSVVSMMAFVMTHHIVTLAALGLFVFASGPVLLASFQDVGARMPTFMNSMYMFINFGISSLGVLGVGVLGDSIGLVMTYQCCLVFAIGTVPMAWILTGAMNTPK